MEHRQYIEHYLSADVDDELSAAERRAVTAHLAGCADCRQHRGSERALKSLLRERMPVVPAPPELQERILAALDREAARNGTRHVWVKRRPLWFVSLTTLAAAAAVVAVIVITKGSQTRNPAFEAAVADYLKSEERFTPNVRSRSLDDLAVTLADQFGFPYVWDFSSLRMALAGARIDHQADGKVVVYSLYKGASGSVLCINFRDLDYSFPPGGEVLNGVRFYKYRKLYIGAVRYGSVFCLIVTRLTPAALAPALTSGAPATGTSFLFPYSKSSRGNG